ncbi:uncharacterized protein LOC117641881 isoform X2 [Thrips palmi]|uniref:Uncharacterized protein LOC117641881 isoform X2 n=1 Tax=Thrips palmi TaxID=161013 RepID=A0A6P8YF27_THRPL|nr:uncharacterized protein LOC117641881 isoform X2 [Thrips palmi]
MNWIECYKVCLAMMFAVMVQIVASSSVLLRTDSVETSRDDLPSTTEPAVTNVGVEYTTPMQDAVAPQDSLDAESEDFEDETYLIKFESAALDGPDAAPLPRWEAQRLHGEAPGRVRRDSIVVRPLEVTRSRGSLTSRQRDAKKKRGREQRPGAAQ